MEKQTLSEASMDKPWIKLKDGEKIERMRNIIKSLQHQLSSVEESNRKLKGDLEKHDHLNGQIVRPVGDYTGSLGTLRAGISGAIARQDPEKVYF